MILSGKEITRQVERGRIVIDPYDESRINPNSYNLRLDDKLLIYKGLLLDMATPMSTQVVTIPETGFLLQPNVLYLGSTIECAGSDYYVPMHEGRSSVGRLGLYVHVTAGFGDIGFKSRWTLELHAIQPIVIYPYIDICQIYFHTTNEDYDLYDGKYKDNDGVQGSMMYREFD